MLEHIPDSLRVDVSVASSREELHHLLASAFHFPDYYGHNWDAFDECIRDVELPASVEIAGLEALRARLPRDADLLQQCVRDFVAERHHDITILVA